jgi:hypothetical protein
MAKQSLLEKAKEIPTAMRECKVSEEQLELVQAWLNNEVTLTQVMKVTGRTTSTVYVLLAIASKELYTRKRNG